MSSSIKGKARDITEALGRVPPQALDVEEIILGATMLESRVYLEVSQLINENDFYSEAHKSIWRAISQLHQVGQPIDMRTVIAQLKKIGLLEPAGGMAYVASLTANVTSAANVMFHAAIIKEESLRRQVIQLAGKFSMYAYDDTIDIFETLNLLQKEAVGIATTSSAKKCISQFELYTKTLDDLQKKSQQSGVTGIHTGFRQLDRITSGWQNTDLVIIAARPGMGKSAYVLATALACDKPVALFSLEMSAKQLEERLMSITYDITNDRLKTGFLEDHQWNLLGADPKGLASRKIFIDDEAGLSISELRTRCRKLKAEQGIGLILVDYLQLMQGDRNKNDNREQEIGTISRGLKGVAKELDVPVIALSQLSRSVETRGGDKRPMLSDLRESGSIEQDADIVMFLYRPEYYGITVDADGFSTIGMAEVIIEKNRGGATGTVNVRFIGPLTKFLDEEPRTKTIEQERQLTPYAEAAKKKNQQPLF